MEEVREIRVGELQNAYPIVRQLRKHLSMDDFIELARQMMGNGYRAFCLFTNGKIVAYTGIAVLTNLYYGKHIWVYELVVDEALQGKGYGKQMLSFVEQYAKDNSISCIALSSGLEKVSAHKFYEKSMNYKTTSNVFVKILNDEGVH